MDAILAATCLAALVVAFLYTLMPEHWAPYVALAHAGKWSGTKLGGAIVLGMAAHVVATLIMGVIVSIFGLAVVAVAGRYADSFAGVLVTLLGGATVWRERSGAAEAVLQPMGYLASYRQALSDGSFGSGKSGVLPPQDPSGSRPLSRHIGNLLMSPAVAMLPLFVMASATGVKPGLGHALPVGILYVIATASGLWAGARWFRSDGGPIPFDWLFGSFSKVAGMVIVLVGLIGITLGAMS